MFHVGEKILTQRRKGARENGVCLALTFQELSGEDLWMLDTIRTAWHWTGLNPAEIIAFNLFGNLIVKDTDRAFWRICPEELKCEKVAANAKQFAELSCHPDFQSDWAMERLVKIAEEKLGHLKPNYCYCLKLSPIVGGTYDASNIGEIPIKELIAFSGDFAKQIKDIPDGEKIEIKIVP